MSAKIQEGHVTDNARENADSWFTPSRMLVVIAFLIFAAYPEVVLGVQSMVYRDFGLFTCPVAWFHRASLWHGEIPLWNPLNDCGLPFLAQWNTTVLYPFSLIYVLLPLPWSMDYFCLAHLLLAGWAMYSLALRWTGSRLGASAAGVAFAWNGLSVHCLIWTSNLAALAWMPLVVLLVERAWESGGRRLLLAALVAAIQMLTGSPEIILMTWLVLGALAVAHGFRKQVRWGILICRTSLIVALVAALSAAQILPFLDLMALSDRNGSFSNNAWAMPAWGWANFIVPLFHCSPSILHVYSQDEQQWTSSYYIGIGALALALLAIWRFRKPRVGLLAGMAIAGVLLAMGGNEPLYRLVSVVPIFGFMRYPIKLVVLTTFAVPLLAGYAIAGWQCLQPRELANATKRLTGVAIFLLILIAGILFAAHQQLHVGESWPVTLASGVSRATFLVLILCALFWWGRLEASRAQRIAGVAILFFIGLDGLTHTPKQNPTVITAGFGPVGVQELVTARLGQSRAMESPHSYVYFEHAATTNLLDYYVGQRRALHPDCNLLDGIPVVGGFFSLYPKETTEIQDLLYRSTNSFPEPLVDFLGVTQISSPDVMFEWVKRPNAMPLLTAGQRPQFASANETLRALASADFNPRATVFLPPEAASLVTTTNSSAVQVNTQVFSAQKITTEITAPQPAMLVIAQTYYHCWRASVDGAPVQLWRANHAFQALEVPAGHHTVQLVYRDHAFELGVFISLAALALWAGAWLRAAHW